MVFSLGRGLRSVVEIAAMLSLIQAERSTSGSGDLSSAGIEEICSVSDGDKAFGIRAVPDTTCGVGGLGCYNDHCRFCKVLDTLKSAHFESCASLGVEFASMAPLAVTTSPCTVSMGDSAVGVAGMTDFSCLYGGIGCFNDHCRFCQTESTPQSSQFVSCSWQQNTTSPSGSGIVGTGDSKDSSNAGLESIEAASADVCTLTASVGDTAAGINITTDASCVNGGVGCVDSICRTCKVSNSSLSWFLNDCPVPTKVCTTTVSQGDAAVGLNIVTDSTCAQGGLGCIDGLCRFCRVANTTQSAPYIDCNVIAASPVVPTTTPVVTTPAPTPTATPTATTAVQKCTQTVSEGDAAVGIAIITDSSCAFGGLGCIDQVCRFCKTTTTAQSGAFIDCPSTIAAPAPTTTSPAPTPAPTPVPAMSAPTVPSASNPAISFNCTRTVASGDKSVGLDIVSDITCSDGGVGCLDDVCRFCKRFDTVQSQSYLNCSSIPDPNVGADITFVPIPIVDDSEPPATRNLASTETVGSSSSSGNLESAKAGFESALASSKVCTVTVSTGDASVGINMVTDASCTNGGLGCVSDTCRFCRVFSTAQSAHFGSCSDYSAGATPAVVPAPTTVATPASTTSTYAIQLECFQKVSDGDKKLGMNIVTDIRCGEGGVGCVDSICRFCKFFDTDQSRAFLNCRDIPAANYGSDIRFVPIAPVNDQESSSGEAIVSIHESSEAAEESGACAGVALADGQAQGGIGIVLDTVNCPEGLSSGCIGDIGCRYCKRFPTNISGYLEYCAVVNATDMAYTVPNYVDEDALSVDKKTFSVDDKTSSAHRVFEHVRIAVLIGIAACVAVVAVVALAAYGMKRTVKTLTRTGIVSPQSAKYNDTPVALVASTVGEVGVIAEACYVVTEFGRKKAGDIDHFDSSRILPPSYVMGSFFSHEPVTVSPLTHHFQSTTQAGTLVYVALSKKKHKVNPITDSRRIDNSVFFGLKVPFDEIEIESQIGTGTFGVVYKAFYKGKHIALKRLLAQRYSAKTVQDFKNELSILSILQHPNIVAFLGAVLEPPTLCLLTELCAGSLADLLQLARSKQLNITWGLTLEIALDCAKACAYLHALTPAVLHRDIKGENLLITEDFRCKLSDFGLSRSLDKNTNAQTMCGTPRWLAPEVFRGEDYSEKVDVYSYGIVLWELFCFKKPYLDKDAINLAYLVAHEDLRPELLPHIPEILHRIMKACWDPDPQQRPSFSTVIFLIEEAKNVVPLGLAIDLSKSFSEATAVQRHHLSTRPKTPSSKKNYGLTSGMI